MTRDDAIAFAEAWIANWNRRDVEAVVSHFTDDACFVSPRAERLVGRAKVQGKAALCDYWQAAAARAPSLHFTLDHVVWDADRRALVVFYDSDVGGTKLRACELMTFNEAGRQISGEALYGATPSA